MCRLAAHGCAIDGLAVSGQVPHIARTDSSNTEPQEDPATSNTAYLGLGAASTGGVGNGAEAIVLLALVASSGTVRQRLERAV
jgi:hypothetical protein